MPLTNSNSPKPQPRHPLLTIAALALAVFLILSFRANSWPLPSAQAAVARSVDGAASVTPSATPPCPPDWSIVTSPNPSASTNYLSGVDALSPNDVWAVGTYKYGTGTYGYMTLALHWNGVQWTQIPSPNPNPNPDYGMNGFSDVEAISSNDVWAVGYTYYAGTSWLTLTEHWNGTEWSIVPSPNVGPSENYLRAVSAISSTDVWAVGNYVANIGGQGYNRTLVEHWDGVQWSVVPSPNVGTENNQLDSISAVSANDVWAVGYTASNGANGALIEHWNGVQWSIVSNPNPPGTHVSNLYGVSALSSNDVWVVGRWGDGADDHTLIKHWDGVQWSVVPSPDVAADNNRLNDVSALSTSDVWAVGYFCCGANGLITLAMHWDGVQWSIIPSPNPSPYNNYFQAVAAISSTDVWAVGYYGPGWRTLTEHYSITDACLTPSATPTSTGTPTSTRTPSSTRTSTYTRTPTSTVTSTPTLTVTPTFTPTYRDTPTHTDTPTSTNTPIPTLTPTITPTFVTTLVGHANWEGRPAQPHTLQQVPITLTLKLGTLEVDYPSQVTDQYGFFTITIEGLPNGTYNWRANDITSPQHPPNYLAKSGTVVLSGEAVINLEAGMMRTGDANNDNVVSTQDFTILKNTFGKGQGDPGYDKRADFNGSNAINTQDFNLLKGNFGQGGAPAIR